jgi:hypothetical protein
VTVPVVVMLIVVLPAVVIVAGLNVAETPGGASLTPNETVPVKPDPGDTVSVSFMLLPATTFAKLGEVEGENYGTTVIVLVGGFGSVRPELSVTVSDAT